MDAIVGIHNEENGWAHTPQDYVCLDQLGSVIDEWVVPVNEVWVNDLHFGS